MVIENIYLSWRAGNGERRILVGLLKRDKQGYSFAYNNDSVCLAKDSGFNGYPEFPDFKARYIGESIINIFAQRIIPISRPDRERVLQFWRANNPSYDYFDILGFTQGKLPTDNFEFLADFPFIKNLTFVTDLAGVKFRDLKKEDLETISPLHFEFEPENEYDQNSVAIFKGKAKLGYIKKVHQNFFHKAEINKNIIMQIVDKNVNGKVNQIFLEVKAL